MAIREYPAESLGWLSPRPPKQADAEPGGFSTCSFAARLSLCGFLYCRKRPFPLTGQNQREQFDGSFYLLQIEFDPAVLPPVLKIRVGDDGTKGTEALDSKPCVIDSQKDERRLYFHGPVKGQGKQLVHLFPVGVLGVCRKLTHCVALE